MNRNLKITLAGVGLVAVAALVYVLRERDGEAQKPDAPAEKQASVPEPDPMHGGPMDGGHEYVGALKALLAFPDVERVSIPQLVAAYEPHGGQGVVHTAEFAQLYDGLLFLDLQDARTVHSMIAIARRLRIVEVTPSLEKLIAHKVAPEAARLAAMRALFVLGRDEAASAELNRRIDTLDQLNSAERDFVIGMTAMQSAPDAEATLQRALDVLDQRMAKLKSDGLQSEELRALGELGHASSVAKRYLLELKHSREVEKAAEAQGAGPLVEELIQFWNTTKRRERALQAIVRMNLRDDAIRKAKQLEATTPPAKVVVLLKLRDRLGDSLTAEEAGRLQAASPPLPRDSGGQQRPAGQKRTED